MEKTKIILVRHGESIGNALGMSLGHTNLGLSEVGHRQARITAEHLKNEKIDAVYSSDLLRAHDTAVPHAELRGLTVIDSEGLREVNIGEWEGKLVSDLKRDHYEDFVIKWQQGFGTFTFPGGDNVMASATRFYNEVLRIARAHQGECVLIAAHAAVIRAFWCMTCNIAPENMAQAYPYPTNASYSTLYFDGEKFTPIEYSFDKHMTEYSEPIQ